MSARSYGSVRRLNNFGARSGVNGSNQTCSVPSAALLHEHDLPVLGPDAQHVAVVGEVDHPAARALLDLAGEVRAAGCSRRCAPCTSCRRLVCPAFSFSTMSGSPAAARNVGSQSWCCTISLDTLPRLDLSRPADHLRNPERALPVGGLLAAERGGRAVGPGVGMRAVVGAVDDDGVLGDARVRRPDRAAGRHCGRGRSSCRGTATASGRPGRGSPAWCGSGSACGSCSSTRRTACRPRAGA